ncbi:hypothetical protein DFJ73DRAFT_212617 [Zopfochytrium polystomum]|nr:hypothetical protein DFJ73DRAFT_212617 [Zopfochytrium polystomum]
MELTSATLDCTVFLALECFCTAEAFLDSSGLDALIDKTISILNSSWTLQHLLVDALFRVFAQPTILVYLLDHPSLLSRLSPLISGTSSKNVHSALKSSIGPSWDRLQPPILSTRLRRRLDFFRPCFDISLIVRRIAPLLEPPNGSCPKSAAPQNHAGGATAELGCIPRKRKRSGDSLGSFAHSSKSICDDRVLNDRNLEMADKADVPNPGCLESDPLDIQPIKKLLLHQYLQDQKNQDDQQAQIRAGLTVVSQKTAEIANALSLVCSAAVCEDQCWLSIRHVHFVLTQLYSLTNILHENGCTFNRCRRANRPLLLHLVQFFSSVKLLLESVLSKWNGMSLITTDASSSHHSSIIRMVAHIYETSGSSYHGFAESNTEADPQPNWAPIQSSSMEDAYFELSRTAGKWACSGTPVTLVLPRTNTRNVFQDAMRFVTSLRDACMQVAALSHWTEASNKPSANTGAVADALVEVHAAMLSIQDGLECNWIARRWLLYALAASPTAMRDLLHWAGPKSSKARWRKSNRVAFHGLSFLKRANRDAAVAILRYCITNADCLLVLLRRKKSLFAILRRLQSDQPRSGEDAAPTPWTKATFAVKGICGALRCRLECGILGTLSRFVDPVVLEVASHPDPLLALSTLQTDLSILLHHASLPLDSIVGLGRQATGVMDLIAFAESTRFVEKRGVVFGDVTFFRQLTDIIEMLSAVLESLPSLQQGLKFAGGDCDGDGDAAATTTETLVLNCLWAALELLRKVMEGAFDVRELVELATSSASPSRCAAEQTTTDNSSSEAFTSCFPRTFVQQAFPRSIPVVGVKPNRELFHIPADKVELKAAGRSAGLVLCSTHCRPAAPLFRIGPILVRLYGAMEQKLQGLGPKNRGFELSEAPWRRTLHLIDSIFWGFTDLVICKGETPAVSFLAGACKIYSTENRQRVDEQIAELTSPLYIVCPRFHQPLPLVLKNLLEQATAAPQHALPLVQLLLRVLPNGSPPVKHMLTPISVDDNMWRLDLNAHSPLSESWDDREEQEDIDRAVIRACWAGSLTAVKRIFSRAIRSIASTSRPDLYFNVRVLIQRVMAICSVNTRPLQSEDVSNSCVEVYDAVMREMLKASIEGAERYIVRLAGKESPRGHQGTIGAGFRVHRLDRLVQLAVDFWCDSRATAFADLVPTLVSLIFRLLAAVDCPRREAEGLLGNCFWMVRNYCTADIDPSIGMALQRCRNF